jgi:hypothetical protein
LQVVNQLYDTTFEEASEFSRAKKGSQSLVEFGEKTFGANDGRAKMLEEAVPMIEELISMRNAVEHPEGLSGKLVIANFTADRKLDEPTWHREKNGKAMQTCIQNLLTLGEGVFVSWASDHLQAQGMMRIAYIGLGWVPNSPARSRRRAGVAQPALPQRHRPPEDASRWRASGEREREGY